MSISAKLQKYGYVDVTTTLVKMQISQSVITSFDGRSILHRCLQYLYF